MNNVEEFLFLLCENNEIDAAVVEFQQEWGLDCPKTLVFSLLGKVIAENYFSFIPDEIRRLFSIIERGVNSDDVCLRTYIATGLLEALYSRSQSLENWYGLSKYLGDASKRYVDEWASS